MKFAKFALTTPIAAMSVAFFAALSSFAADSAAYVGRAHLIAQWDGIDNSLDASGNRSHDEAATVWSDLSGNGHDITGLTAYGSFMSDMFKKTASCKNKSEQKFGLTAKTFEVVVDVSGYSSGWIVPLSTTDTYFIALQKKNGKTLSVFYGSNVTKKPNCYGVQNVPWPEGDKILISCSTDGVIFLNGEKMESNYSDYWGTNGDNVFCASSAAHGSADVIGYGVSAIRLYDAVLNDEDRIFNALVDRLRFIDKVSSDVLIVTATPGNLGTVSPAYGNCQVPAGEVTCTAPATVWDSQVHATLLGWELFRGEEETPAETGVESPAVFTTDGRRMILRWLWDAEFSLTVKQTANGTVTAKEGWYADGEEVELTATPAEGSAFGRWMGDVPEELRESNPLTLTMDRARTVSARFRNPKVHYVDYVNGVDSGDGTVSPWKTMKYAIENAVEGDELVLEKGTHFCKDNLLVDKKLHIHGAGENWETVFDAEHKLVTNKGSNLKITADGVLVNNITFYRLCCGTYDFNQVVVTGDSVISNCVFTGCGFFPDGGDNRLLIDMQKGELNSCWVTNNVYRYAPIVLLEGVNAVKCDNCVIAENRIVTKESNGGNGILTVRTGQTVVRNCTIAGNTFAATNGAAIYGYLTDSKKGAAHLYNNIVWGNSCTTAGEIHPNAYNGASQQKWFVKNNCWDYDDATRLKDPEGGTNFRNVNANPQFDLAHGGAPRLQLTSPCRNKGDNALGSTASVDILGNPRIKGRKIDIGCVEEPLGPGFGILVR